MNNGLSQCPTIIYRYGIPGKMDTAPHGTECWVSTGISEQFDVYYQHSSDEEDPHWAFIGIKTK